MLLATLAKKAAGLGSFYNAQPSLKDPAKTCSRVLAHSIRKSVLTPAVCFVVYRYWPSRRCSRPARGR